MDMRAAAARVPTVRIVAAKLDIPVATPIKAEWLTAVDWPTASRPDGAEIDTEQLVGRVSLVPISKGEPVLANKLAERGARGGLATLVPEGMRALAVRVDDVVGVAGFIHPGDRVDVIVTMQPDSGAPFASKVILQNVKVLAVGKDVEQRPRDAERPASATVATLMVSPQESEALALGAAKGKLLLTLRGIGDEEFAATRGTVPAALLASTTPPRPEVNESAKEPARKKPSIRVAAPAPQLEPKAQRQVVEILRGDLFEKRDFGKAGER
jgi:pilus assembly protein CpaB